MLKPSFATAFALLFLSAVPLGCTHTTVIVRQAGYGVDVPFRGMYTKFAEGTFKNGRRFPAANATGAASVRIESGKVTYDQAYVQRGELKRVSQLYTFGGGDVRPTGGADFELALTFQGMAGDTQGYSPDRNNPKLEAHRTPSGWKIDLFTTDNNGVIGVLECR